MEERTPEEQALKNLAAAERVPVKNLLLKAAEYVLTLKGRLVRLRGYPPVAPVSSMTIISNG